MHKLVDFLRRQHGGRFVENENLVVAVKHFQNFGALLHTDGDVLDDCVGIDFESVLLAQIHHFFARFFLGEESRLVRFCAQNDVVENTEHLDEFEVLMHHAYAQCGGVVRAVDFDNFSVLQNLAFFGLIQSEKNGHKR